MNTIKVFHFLFLNILSNHFYIPIVLTKISLLLPYFYTDFIRQLSEVIKTSSVMLNQDEVKEHFKCRSDGSFY